MGFKSFNDYTPYSGRRFVKGKRFTQQKNADCIPRTIVPRDNQCINIKYKDSVSYAWTGTSVNFAPAPIGGWASPTANNQMTKLYPNSLYKHDAAASAAESFPYLSGWAALYDRALVTRATYKVTATNTSTSVPYRIFIMFNPYNSAAPGTYNPSTGVYYDPPAGAWVSNAATPVIGWDNLLSNQSNTYWSRAAIAGCANTAQGQCKISHSMYLGDQYGDSRQYHSAVEGSATNFSNELEGEGGGSAPVTGLPNNLLIAYVGWMTLQNFGTPPATTSIPVEITATLETKLYRVTLAKS